MAPPSAALPAIATSLPARLPEPAGRPAAQRSESPRPAPSPPDHVVSRRASFPPPAARGGRGLAPAAKGDARGAGPGRDHVRRGVRRVSRRGGGARSGWPRRSALRHLRWFQPLSLVEHTAPESTAPKPPPSAPRPPLHPHKGGAAMAGSAREPFCARGCPAAGGAARRRPGRRGGEAGACR